MTNRLLELRTERKLALRGLTALSGVSAGTLSAVEKWNYLPAPGTREKVARALGVRVEDIWPAVPEREAVTAEVA